MGEEYPPEKLVMTVALPRYTKTVCASSYLIHLKTEIKPMSPNIVIFI
jgi:hypothetical protein